MPKRAKSKKSKSRSIKRSKKKKSKGSSKSKKSDDSQARALVLALVDKMGGSAAIYQDNPDQIVVARFNHPPFVIYWNHYAIEDVPADLPATQVAEPTPEKAAE